MLNLFFVERYIGDVGDVVVGRISVVESSRWRVDVNSTLDAMLPLTSVNLPGGELVCFSLKLLNCFLRSFIMILFF